MSTQHILVIVIPTIIIMTIGYFVHRYIESKKK
jgi:hypothetical protein